MFIDTFFWRCTGSPKPEVTWYKADSKLKTEDRSEVKYSDDDEIHFLIIVDATADDAGDYTIIAENEHGRFKFTVTVLVGRPEGAEIVKKTIESKRSVKVIEETMVDGKMVERVVQEDVTEDVKEDEPKKETVSETTKMVMQETPKTEDVETAFMITLGGDTEAVELTGTKTVKTDTSKTEETTIKAESTETTMTEEGVVEEKASVTKSKPAETHDVSSTDSFIIEDAGEPPKFVVPPEPVFVDVGETVKLSCKVTGWDQSAKHLELYIHFICY